MRHCIALFPQTWAGSTSFIEVSDYAPVGIQKVRIDGKSS
jgi:hypothetical protein